MVDEKITIYKSNGKVLGYFNQVQISRFGENEYAIQGTFHNANGDIPEKIDFNPQALPYSATVEGIDNIGHKQLINIYVQRGRQPVNITAVGKKD